MSKVLCVWEGIDLGDNTPEEFEAWLKDEFKVDGTYLETVVTLPDVRNGKAVPGTGGRLDIFFEVDSANPVFGGFCVKRLAYNIRWYEDVIANGGGAIYPAATLEKYKAHEAYPTVALSEEEPDHA